MRTFLKNVSRFSGLSVLFSQIFFDNTMQKYIIRTDIANRYTPAGAAYSGCFFKGDAELSALLLT